MKRSPLPIVAAVVTVVVAAQPASATFAGANGKIVFNSLHAGENEIWVMNADGTDRRNLTRHNGAKIVDWDPQYTADGRKIVFSSNRSGSFQIWMMDGDGSNPRQVTDLPGRNRFPAPTADGKQIVFQSFVGGQFEVYRVDVDGSNVINLTNHPAVDWAPATSARGKKVVFTSERDGNGHLHVLDSGSQLTRITNTAGYDSFAAWSPRGNEIVFVRDDSSGTDLYLVHSDGSGDRRLTETPSLPKLLPTFSPDGTKVAYTACPVPTNVAENRCSTRVLDLASGIETNLEFPAASPPNPFYDEFSGPRNAEIWGVIHEGRGAFIEWVDDRLEISFAPSIEPFPPLTFVATHAGFHCLLTGDFEASVDYELLEWPIANGVQLMLFAFYADALVGRESKTWGEQYFSFVAPSFGGWAPTADVKGRLKIVRSAGVMTAYYRSDNAWAQLASAPASPNPVVIGLVGHADTSSFAGQAVRVAFDNFELHASGRDCSSWRPDFHPSWQPLVKPR